MGLAIQGVVAYSVVYHGNGIVTVVAPLLLEVLPVFRPALLGDPPVWSNRPYTQADEDAAAEDFNIY